MKSYTLKEPIQAVQYIGEITEELEEILNDPYITSFSFNNDVLEVYLSILEILTDHFNYIRVYKGDWLVKEDGRIHVERGYEFQNKYTPTDSIVNEEYYRIYKIYKMLTENVSLSKLDMLDVIEDIISTQILIDEEEE